MARKRRKVGDVLQVDLPDGSMALGIVLEEPLVGFFDKKFISIPSMEELVNLPLAFSVMVMNQPIWTGRWRVVGHVDDVASFHVPRLFKVDESKKLVLRYHIDGREEPIGQKEDIRAMEYAAVWYPEHVEQRLLDHFSGVENDLVREFRQRALRI